jgi:CRISPR-associated endonuclease/helicase Cas3
MRYQVPHEPPYLEYNRVPYVLWRTWEILCEGKTSGTLEIVLPRDYRILIEAVYSTSNEQHSQETIYAAAISEARKKLQTEQDNERVLARKQLTPPADVQYDSPITSDAGLDFVEDEHGALSGWQVAKTRLGDRITVVPLYLVGEKLTFDAEGRLRRCPPALRTRPGYS